tara:strand:- start:1855 stop:2106 length:252 start_codon:yes stop_codon:yes gene_type:complete
MDFFEKIKEKLEKKIKPEKIILIDNSKFHKKHKSFDPKKFNLKIIIISNKLKNMDRISAHREVFSILKDEMKNRIHALEIEIQ